MLRELYCQGGKGEGDDAVRWEMKGGDGRVHCLVSSMLWADAVEESVAFRSCW